MHFTLKFKLLILTLLFLVLLGLLGYEQYREYKALNQQLSLSQQLLQHNQQEDQTISSMQMTIKKLQITPTPTLSPRRLLK